MSFEDGVLSVFPVEKNLVLQQFLGQIKSPTVFLRRSEQVAASARLALKILYEYLVKTGGRKQLDGLEQLYVDQEFDVEQVWFQLEGQLEYCQKRIRKLVNRLEKKADINILDPELSEALDELLAIPSDDINGNKILENEQLNGFLEDDSDMEEEEEGGDEEGKGDEFEDEDEEEKAHERKRQKLSFEDDFMNVDEMDKFLEEAELAHQRGEDGEEDELEKALNEEITRMGKVPKDSQDVDPNADDDVDLDEAEEDVEDGIYYDEFFGPRKPRMYNGNKIQNGEDILQDDQQTKRVRFSDDLQEDDLDGDKQDDRIGSGSSEDEEEEYELDQNGTTQEVQQHQLKKQIKSLEKDALGEKEWFMKGEVMAYQRPKDSVFEVDLDYDRTRKPPPEPTEAGGLGLEETIKRRIAEGKFDDVIRIVPMPPKKEKKEIVLDDTQNKEGLASLYEQEYVRSAAGNVTNDKHASLREEIRQLYQKVAYQLDALSHYSFAPMPVIEELTVKADVPAIAMEEVGANAVATDVSIKLPQEVYQSQTKDGVLKEDSELTKEDIKRRRRQLKAAYQAKEKREMQQKGELPANLGGWAMLAGRKSMLKQARQTTQKTKFNTLHVFKQLESEKAAKSAKQQKE
eukprot:TRINITY_DN4467_c0_g1_i5.p1 TRINITY_DN4467_c0_g1~~TRINITY_DN4467_c0_g1_i5.p1  ORF type:complete len:629 (+),score=163.59 TRINITY_DN4467_c0_g1_i5:60-1946(+)